MTAVRRVRILCDRDGCDNALVGAEGERGPAEAAIDVRARGRALGWVQSIVGGLDYCPDHP